MAAVIGIGVIGIGIYQSSASAANPELSGKEIQDIVKKQYPGTIIATELEKDTNNAFYKVETESNGNKYHITLDGNTGEVINLEAIGTIDIAQKDTDEKSQADEQSEQSAEEDNKGPEQNQKETSSNNAMISENKAKEIALGQFDGTVAEIELDEDDGKYVYEVEVENQNGEATIEIDAYTGKVVLLDIESEVDDDDD